MPGESSRARKSAVAIGCAAIGLRAGEPIDE
jgi:hypothetical protein